jgi:hypothetical protein
MNVKAEKYIISAEGTDASETTTRWGFGAASEEVQRFLSKQVPKVRIRIDGTVREAVFAQDKDWRLLDIKQRLKTLSNID